VSKKILLVEKDEFYIEVIGTFVKLFLQHQLLVVRSPGEALATAKAEHPNLILLDLESNGNQALEFAERLRDDHETKSVPILALSQDATRRDDALGRGCAGFLTKPFRIRELEALIDKHLGR
jgi:two-component system cell cycle response regulator DivK